MPSGTPSNITPQDTYPQIGFLCIYLTALATKDGDTGVELVGRSHKT